MMKDEVRYSKISNVEQAKVGLILKRCLHLAGVTF